MPGEVVHEGRVEDEEAAVVETEAAARVVAEAVEVAVAE